MASQPYEIKLENIFEGPMDLLVHLIKKNEVDIYDIPISLITDQFLAYLDWMKSLNIEVAGDFLVMAATLAHIKSRMLLPSVADDSAEEDEEDPRVEITEQLLEYLQMKSVADQLCRRPILDEDVFTRHADSKLSLIDLEAQVAKTDLFELIHTFHKLLENTSGKNGLHITPDRISVKDRMTEIIQIMEEKKTITFRELIAGRLERIEIIVTFLAVLEIIKLNLARIVFNKKQGILRLYYI
jgi:segregation and condensation protein A